MSNKTPSVSVVIPTYNRAPLLRRALQSVIDQSINDWEVLVVDNHSDDDTDGVVRSFNDTRIKLLKVHNHGIIATSRNVGIREARGEWIALLDSDDWWAPRKLEHAQSALKEGNDLVYHDMLRIYNGWRDYLRRKMPTWSLNPPVYDDLIARGNAIVNSSVVVRRDLILKIGGFSEDEEMVAAEDFDCWLRLARITDRFQRLSGVYGYYWYGGGNMTTAERTIRNYKALAKIYLSDITVPASLPFWFRYTIGREYYRIGDYKQTKNYLSSVKLWNLKPIMAAKVLRLKIIGNLLATRDTRS